MAALVQTYPQQSGTVTLLQTRPSSASGRMPGPSGTQPNPAYMGNSQRNNYHGLSNSVGGGQTVYRGNTSTPVQPYAFTATPNLANGGQWQQYGAYRSSTSVPNMQMTDPNASARSRPVNSNTPGNNTSYSSISNGMSQDDSRVAAPSGPRPQLAPLNISSNQPTFAQVAASKAAPERYRRPSAKHTDSSPGVMQAQQPQGSAIPSGSGMATVVHLYNPRAMPDRKAGMSRNSVVSVGRPHSAYGSMAGVAVDDMQLYRHPTEEEAKRFRRRSIHSINSSDYPNPPTPQEFKKAEESFRLEALAASRKHGSSDKSQKIAPRPVSGLSTNGPVEKNSMHRINGSSESLVSSGSSNSRPSSSANRNSSASAPTASPASTSTSADKKTGHDQSKQVNIPPRGSSTDVGKRTINPSPLSKPVTMGTGSSSDDSGTPANASEPPLAKSSAPTSGSMADSPAAKQLAAINEKGGKSKSKTSRLRRAFSFGSAAELRKAAGQDITTSDAAKISQNETSRLHKDPRPEDLYEEEQARIAQKQEESGIGSSIYSGTKLFSGSTDNLSISSTASSASIMLRKMGRGMKKGGRSLVGLFRPKSIIGSPEDLKLPEVSQAEVSMVTVEAERERVNVNVDPHSQQAGGTGFPHLENNSVDVTVDALSSDRLGSSGTDNSGARKSIVGGERERAEVLATIRKGILKTRSNSPSPVNRGPELKGPTFDLPTIPNVSNSPSSSAPSTPNDEVQGHRRSGSVAIGSEDYFVSALRLRQDTRSAPTTPQGSGSKRNATFSPRLIFYDTWPSGEYDRRGDIATCNRLTPMLAQQIKEELNSFKMEMEVHETSKIYTHFF
ncbi:uncharacterized protein GGS22DRAFT_190194 [Annulohypoxylon maeteangense]|uniref:uncharacterized protein n=1 Tax=Annulohypoxylon maeteangense TaxID=1927788 RepID=UPI00200856B9|nr:uncharacterized protein GGS22DRAFT_190194 [Annulohypoxylon maeteangense]KAI0883536.1 hypothetical protein GGS22DRAFT_190194 [Annulohypoxylon maeteangense]